MNTTPDSPETDSIGQEVQPKKRRAKKAEDGPRCEGCVYWLEDKGEGTIGRSGDCRRYPPTVMLDSEDVMTCAFSYTDNTHWCGEFKQRVQ